MEVEVGIAAFESTKIVLVVLGCVYPANVIKVDQRSLFCAVFDEKAKF